MKPTKIICALAAASLALSGAAFAQGNPANTERPANDAQRDTAQHNTSAQSWPGANRARTNSRGARDSQSHARADRNVRQDRGHDARYEHDGRGAGPEHNFYRGGRLPTEYRNRQYVVDDWRDHHLSAPPRGYHWVQAGDDYVLAAIATGIIASILLNSH